MHMARFSALSNCLIRETRRGSLKVDCDPFGTRLASVARHVCLSGCCALSVPQSVALGSNRDDHHQILLCSVLQRDLKVSSRIRLRNDDEKIILDQIHSHQGGAIPGSS